MKKEHKNIIEDYDEMNSRTPAITDLNATLQDKMYYEFAKDPVYLHQEINRELVVIRKELRQNLLAISATLKQIRALVIITALLLLLWKV